MNTIMSVINGRAVASTQAVIEKRYPATGEVFVKIQPATSEMLDEAIQRAKAAQTLWAAQAAHERAWILNRIALSLTEHNKKLSRLEVREGSIYELEAYTEVKATYVQL